MQENLNLDVHIKEQLAEFNANREQCGFEVFIVTKDEPRLHMVSFSDSNTEGKISFKKAIKNMLFDVFAEKFLLPDIEYALASAVADNQRKMYCIPQVEGAYSPFSFLSSESLDFVEEDLRNATGLAFAFRRGEETLWLYQHLWAILVPNKKKVNIMARITKMENGFIFHEQKEPLLTIARKVDLVVLNGTIITENITLMQKSFGFRDYIRIVAQQTVAKIERQGIVYNSEKLSEYIARGNGNTKYAKKFMRIADSAVLKMPPEHLIGQIKTVERWEGVFSLNEAEDAIELKTFGDVEHLIDLLDERYMKSEITGEEYDTDVKKKADPVNKR